MKATLAVTPSTRGIKMPTKIKQCLFPGCGVEFEGIGASKYCNEHRKPEYRKILNDVKSASLADIPDLDQPQLSNQIIIHSHTTATQASATCLCGEKFEVTLYPSIDIYPKYCPKHRNPFQRKLLHEKLGIEDGSFHANPVDITDIIPESFSSNDETSYEFTHNVLDETLDDIDLSEFDTIEFDVDSADFEVSYSNDDF